MVTIWFEPHGTSLDNEASIASGWNDVDLSEIGLQQAGELSDRCADRDITAVFTSDLQRAVKTVVPFVEAAKVPLYIDKRLRECDYGDFTQAPKEKIEEERPKRISEPFPNGESYDQCMKRMTSFMEYLKSHFDGQTVLIVGHRATHYGVEVVAMKKPLLQCVTEAWKWQPGWKYELK